MRFPTLFPWGTGDITVEGVERGFASSDNRVVDYQKWFRHKSGRFSRHPTFSFHVINVIQRRQMKSSSVNWVKQHPLASNASVSA